jgi:exopolysaccharide production protein ExoQ
MQQIATLVTFAAMLVLFYLDRDPRDRVSRFHWIPVLWLALAGSRSVTEWMWIFGLAGAVDATPELYLEGSPLDRNVYLVLMVLGMIVLYHRRRTSILLKANIPLMVYFSYCVISLTWSDHPDVALRRWFKAVGDLVMILMVLTENNPRAAVKRLLTRVSFILLPVSVLFIKYYPALGRDYHPNNGAAWKTAYIGVTTTKNLLGMITLLLGTASLWMVVQVFRKDGTKPTRSSVIAHGVMLVTALYLFWLVDSATSSTCFLIASGIIVVTSFSKTRRRPGIIHLLAIGAVGFSLLVLFVAPALLETVGRDSTLTGRTDVWKLALGMAGNPLVGTGFESFWLGWRVEKVWNLYRFHLQEAHNGYLELYLNLGWIGIGLLGVLLVTGYRNVFVPFRRHLEFNSVHLEFSSLRLTFFIIAVIYNLTEAAFKSMNPVWILFLFAIINIPENALARARPAVSAGEAEGLDQPELLEQPEPSVSWAFDTESPETI